MNLFEMLNTDTKEIQNLLDKSMKKLPNDQYKVVVCQSCGKPNRFSYKNLYEKTKIGRKIIKKCEKCNESIILKKED